jgi:hypothetical protein
MVAMVAFLALGPAEADELTHVRALRSLAAEAAEVIRLEAQHRVTGTYAREMKQETREQIASEAQSAQSPQIKQLAQQAIGALGRNDANALTRISQQLFKMEGPYGRAD